MHEICFSRHYMYLNLNIHNFYNTTQRPIKFITSLYVHPIKSYSTKVCQWIQHKDPFTIGTLALYITLRSDLFGFTRAISYVTRALAFIACVFVVKSSLLKILDIIHTIQTLPNVIHLKGVLD